MLTVILDLFEAVGFAPAILVFMMSCIFDSPWHGTLHAVWQAAWHDPRDLSDALIEGFRE